MKKIALFFIFILLMTTPFILVQDKPERFIPYTYQFDYTPTPPAELSEATILFVGDRLAKSFSLFSKELIDEVFERPDTPFKTFNWAKNGEGLHRTIYKLKQLKKYPPLVIYIGGTQEFYEKKFNLDEHDTIMENFKRFENPTYQSLIMLIPYLSKFIYKSTSIIHLSKQPKKQDLDFVKAESFMLFNELLFTNYRHELAELFQLAQDRNFKLLVIIPPLNIDLPILNNCLATQPTASKRHKQIRKLLQDNDLVEAHTQALLLYNDDPTNGLNAQLLAKTLIALGKIPEAINYLEKATNYDCDLTRGNSVINAILLKQLKNYGIPYSDFHKYLLNFYGKNVLFFDAILPQRYYYNKYIVKLAKQIRELLNL